MELRKDAEKIIRSALEKTKADSTVYAGLESLPEYKGRLFVIAMGKAAWQMAQAVKECGLCFEKGLVITKYGHVMGEIEGFEMFEAGHPIPDDGSIAAAERALELTENLTEDDMVLTLISGGASALFESPAVSLLELADITAQLLACGADITEINTMRKRLSKVKGGRFALHCAPAKVHSIILSDVLGDVPDMIASGPCCADPSTCDEAMAIAKKYGLRLSDKIRELLKIETPKALSNATFSMKGSVRVLCQAAEDRCRELGYETVFLTDRLCCQAREAGAFLASIARTHCTSGKKLAFIAGGETVVKLTGRGKGGRNQELALAAAAGIEGIENALIFSIGSDGTDGPTDAAGGMVSGSTAGELRRLGYDIEAVLDNNDAYTALKACAGLIITGPTGTNVNDLCCVLIG